MSSLGTKKGDGRQYTTAARVVEQVLRAWPTAPMGVYLLHDDEQRTRTAPHVQQHLAFGRCLQSFLELADAFHRLTVDADDHVTVTQARARGR